MPTYLDLLPDELHLLVMKHVGPKREGGRDGVMNGSVRDALISTTP
eukprot:SAG22_NODE_4385_length_1281_cov_1.522766_1_plen_45_part_10